MLVGWRACSHRLSRFPACHYVDVQALKIPLLIRSRAYHNVPSFSTRPDTLAAKIWLRRDGTPRSKWKGALYVSLSALFYGMLLVMGELETQNKAVIILFQLQFVDVNFSSADLSTPQGAFTYLCDLFCALATGKQNQSVIHRIFERCTEFMNSEQCSAETREKLHKIARETGEAVHLGIQKAKSKDELIEDVAVDVVKLLILQLTKIDELIFDKSPGTLDIMKYLENKERKGKSDGYDVVG